jgi:3-oxoacyl-[acyl-carrier protein] reductase
MTKLLSQKRCLITGGSRGFGRALCLAFAEAGARVAFTYLKNDEEAQKTKELLVEKGCEVLTYKGSVSDASHVNETVKQMVSAWGGVDVLVNNAAITQILPIALLDESDWDSVINTNLKGVYLFSRAVLRIMIRQKKGPSRTGSHILCIGSFAADRVVEAPVHFAASKAAVRGFCEALAKEVGRYQIAVNVVEPGLLNVGFAQKLPKHRLDEYISQCALGRVGLAEEVAKSVVWLVSEENTFMTGAKLSFDGGV